MRARTHSSWFFCLNARQKFHHHSLELVSMVQLSQCQQKWFILFHVFCLFHFFLSSVGSVCLAGLLSQQARQKRTRVLFFLKRAQVCDGVDTVIVFARIFGAHFFVSFLTFQFFVLLFVIFWGNFRSSGQRFFIFFNNKYGRARKKKHNSFFWAQLFLLNRSSGGLDYVMSDDLTSFFFLSYNLLRMLT